MTVVGLFTLICPECCGAVFARASEDWSDAETELCEDCGAKLAVEDDGFGPDAVLVAEPIVEIRRLREECERLRTELAEANNSLTHARELLDLERYAAERPALFSVREAMRAAGVKGWENGSGVSSADAVRMIAAERDQARQAAIELRDQCFHMGMKGLWVLPWEHALARIDTLSDDQLAAEAAQAMAERPEPHGDCEECIEVDE